MPSFCSVLLDGVGIENKKNNSDEADDDDNKNYDDVDDDDDDVDDDDGDDDDGDVNEEDEAAVRRADQQLAVRRAEIYGKQYIQTSSGYLKYRKNVAQQDQYTSLT